MTSWRTWAEQVWAQEPLAAAIEHASPVLAEQVRELLTGTVTEVQQARRLCRSLARYVLRAQGRATPFGLFSGVAPASFTSVPAVSWGKQHHHVARASSAWLDEVIRRLEAVPDLLLALPLMVNNTAFVRGSRLVLPHPPHLASGKAATELSLRYTTPVRIAVESARAPIRGEDLVQKIAAELPGAPLAKVTGLLSDLVRRGVLLTCLHAPLGVFDALGHLVDELVAVGADQLEGASEATARLRTIRALFAEYDRSPAAAQHSIRARLRSEMSTLSKVVQPVAVDSRTDCAITLPDRVAREAETAATLLARLSPYPAGAPAWNAYHNRFFERYGIGALVPVLDLVDPDVGLGFPAGFLSSEPESPEGLSARDRRLLTLAQTAALEGRNEIVLTEERVAALEADAPELRRIPLHLELKFRVESSSMSALARGDFHLRDVSASRGAGTLTGRFLDLLDTSARARAHDVLAGLPVSDAGTQPAQVSFASVDRAHAHVMRAPEILPDVISVGEHRQPNNGVLPLEDLAVGCDPHRLYLVSLSRGCRLNPLTFNALELRVHTPPLVRFLVEITRASTCAVVGFSWGAAEHLPYLPRVRAGRIVLASARWRLAPSDLPREAASDAEWVQAFSEWRARRRVPATVALVEQDRHLPLDLTRAADLELVRAHLRDAAVAVLVERSPDPDGWLNQHAHEVVVPLTAADAPQWPSLPPVSRERLLTRAHGHIPGASRWLLAKIYGHAERQPELLAHHVPELLARWDSPPAWWYMRYRDPAPHLRLRIELSEDSEFGQAAARIGAWAARLRELGLLREIQFATSYPEPGRWGQGPALAAAEAVFCADSRSLATTFALPSRPHPQALAAANFLSIASAFTGSVTAGMDWIIKHTRLADPRPLDRAVRSQAISLADPTLDWAGLRAVEGGETIHGSWTDRDSAIRAYRAELKQTSGYDEDRILDSLLHVHHIRAAGIDKDDERVCLRLTRAAALAWKATRT
ncbi:lantibiotic dehydratase [Streptomyces sp. NRRL B-24572]|uniref:lantibiotic dehydratase n=1 Tax=Streptomyces sp. NRRL B-24572 TaxID=1962156 RepID=UPI00211B17F4|nr:lantibiotic dehydratase [Streptomyces sp. NRRL B-24572]